MCLRILELMVSFPELIIEGPSSLKISVGGMGNREEEAKRAHANYISLKYR